MLTSDVPVTLDLPQALLLAFGESGPDVTEEEFNDWYDNEHAPLRLTVKGVSSALRYKANDAKTPTWLALYELSSPEVMLSEEFQSLRSKASLREADVMSRALTLDRRLYTQISMLTNPSLESSSIPGKYLLVVSMEPTAESEADFNKWYKEEHIPLISKVPGWLRGRRYKCVNRAELAGGAVKSDAPAIPYISIHEWSRPDYRDLPEFKHASSTPWRAKVLEKVVRRDVRTFELYKNFANPQ